MPKKTVNSESAPAPVGPYSHAAAAGGWIFLSGQIPIDPASGEIVAEPVEAAAEHCLENLKAVLEEAGAGLGDVVKVTIFLADMGDFPRVNEVYAKYFPSEPPARACVQAAALPKGVPIEIELVAYTGD